MAYGLADVVNQRRMIDEGEAGEDFKRLQRTKLDALLALAEAHDCRRVRLLAYFGEEYGGTADARSNTGLPGSSEPPRGVATEGSLGAQCRNCDNCISAPATWDATEAARKALSCIYRFHQQGGLRFGAGHLIDVLRGKATEKVAQYRHERLSTYGIGAEVSESQWRSVLRQLIALGHLRAEGEYGTLELTPSAREVLRGDVQLLLRVPAELPKRSKAAKTARTGPDNRKPPVPLDTDATQRFAALKAWRAEVAREHNLPAYIVFHDATLAEMAREFPDSLDALAGISGVGAKKLEAYGREILRVLNSP
jgi:ATP-dependent DNA helicase RecQ